KEVFLEWFAATCNDRLSAGKAGVHEKTIYKHLLKDPAFEEAWFRALRLGYARLEARVLQEAHQLRFGRNGTSAEGPLPHPAHGSPPHPAKPGGEEYRINVLD